MKAHAINEFDDKNSWQSKWSQHIGWLRTVLADRLDNKNSVDEVLQNVAIIAWEKRGQLEDDSKMAPWLYRIAIRQVQMFWRRTIREKNRKQSDLIDGQSEATDQGQRNPIDWMTDNEAHQQLRIAIQWLSKQDREILLLKHTEDWTYSQISKQLGISVDKVIYRLSRARKRLRERLVSGNSDWK